MPGNDTASTNTTSLWGPIPTDAGRSLQPDIIVCSLLTWLIAVTFVVLRFYTRSRLNHVLGPTDWCILPALLCAAGVSVSSIEQAIRGAGRHSWELDIYALPALERATWYGILFYTLSLVFTRISILLLYKRIFTHSWVKKAIQVVLVLVIAIGIWLVASVCTACVPLEAFWDWSLFWTTHVYCQPPNLWWGNAALHITSDLVIVTLPMPVLSTLKLPRRQKFALVGVFGLGFFVCIVSVFRLVYLVEMETQQSFDATYTSAKLIFWSTVEVNTSIACACIMTLKPLIQKWFPKLLAGSTYIRDHSLRWITPLNSRLSRHSYINPGVHRQHQRGVSGSECGSNMMPHAEEREGDVSDEARKVLDLEARRSGSVSTVLCDDDSSVGSLSAPPKAHLRLSIHVTKSVLVSKFPESPIPGEPFEEKERGPVGNQRQLDEGARALGPSSPGWQSQGSTTIGADRGRGWAADARVDVR
ncbi:hypothetical protein B0H67DRAFT_639413 [Lasiosphaeris hirsuta]|uniref:Rhodopsin domain-containing protein n=1 Tax=Lasiosphaeris hirsuta TaxID=260670 RepID=A0AA40E8M9_9PEZI|nr:hypothetical protein B0H67DRAFT_639413 [Lasiosphaeris hirsuta]